MFKKKKEMFNKIDKMTKEQEEILKIVKDQKRAIEQLEDTVKLQSSLIRYLDEKKVEA